MVAGGTVIAKATGANMNDIKVDLEKTALAYRESFNRQDAAGIAGLYTRGGIHMNPTGPTMDVEGLYNTILKAGFNYMESNIAEAWSLGPDSAVAMGKYRIAGNDQSGAPIERGGYWTGTYVRRTGCGKFRWKRLCRNKCAISTASPQTKPPSRAVPRGQPLRRQPAADERW